MCKTAAFPVAWPQHETVLWFMYHLTQVNEFIWAELPILVPFSAAGGSLETDTTWQTHGQNCSASLGNGMEPCAEKPNYWAKWSLYLQQKAVSLTSSTLLLVCVGCPCPESDQLM